jgi:hypothetical protein
MGGGLEYVLPNGFPQQAIVAIWPDAASGDTSWAIEVR